MYTSSVYSQKQPSSLLDWKPETSLGDETEMRPRKGKCCESLTKFTRARVQTGIAVEGPLLIVSKMRLLKYRGAKPYTDGSVQTLQK